MPSYDPLYVKGVRYRFVYKQGVSNVLEIC
jgi:hypothetical protein